jgi:hypothetical protein
MANPATPVYINITEHGIWVHGTVEMGTLILSERALATVQQDVKDPIGYHRKIWQAYCALNTESKQKWDKFSSRISTEGRLWIAKQLGEQQFPEICGSAVGECRLNDLVGHSS